MLSAAFKTEKNPRGTCSSCWKNNNSRYLKQCCSFSALEQALNIAEFCEPWPPDTSFFHGLQLSLALPPKPHSQNVHQAVHHTSLPADSSAKNPNSSSEGCPASQAKGTPSTSPQLLYFWCCGVRNTPKLQLCLSLGLLWLHANLQLTAPRVPSLQQG